MTVLLTTAAFLQQYGPGFAEAVRASGLDIETLALPADPDARLTDEECARIDIANFSADMVPAYSRSFFSAAQRAKNLRWFHVFNAGTDLPVFQRLLASGVRITNSSGAAAAPIAQCAIAGMLLLGRGFPEWLDAQRRRAWESHDPERPPADLAGQRMLVIGLGAIGNEIARLATAVGLEVTAIRRSPKRAGDHARVVLPPAALQAALPTADWLALACPLTPETRRLIGERELALLPRGARILNIARGEVVDEAAMIAALRSGQLGGAYLDVFETEPLATDSPLWELPNVVVTPHNSGASSGNDARAASYFLRNLAAWGKGEPLENEVRA